MVLWPNVLIVRASPFGSTACIGSQSPPPTMISCDLTASNTAQPPIAVADSSINAFAASGPVGGADEHAESSINSARTIANMEPPSVRNVYHHVLVRIPFFEHTTKQKHIHRDFVLLT